MDDEEVQKQLDHMVKFIYREADEKAAEIKAKGEEEFSIEKAKLVQDEKVKIMKEFERKEKQIDIKKKIMHSNELNQSRLKLLKAREEGVQKILAVAHDRLAQLSKDQKQYAVLVKALILQGLLKLREPKVDIVCRKEDVNLVQTLLGEAAAMYQQKVGQAVHLEIDSKTFLPSGREHSQKEGEFCSGGIVLSSHEGKIICSNTLDARLAMCFEQNLPTIRNTSYGRSLTRKHND